MTFYVQGLNGHEVMPLLRLFDTRSVKKTPALDPGHRVGNTMDRHENDIEQNSQAGIAIHSYLEMEQVHSESPALIAEQVMTSPVVSCESNDSVIDVMNVFRSRHIRHLPVVTNEGVVEGIISDRDILRYLSGFTEDYKHLASSAKANDRIRRLMTTRVLTASIDTDVRYIARLFVEQRVGAMPIVIERKLKGIITRSDLLAAIMRNFVLELWA